MNEKKNELRNFEDITSNLSEDPFEREQQLFDRILDFFNQFKTHKQDTTTWEGRTFIKLMRLLDKGDQFMNQSVLNAIILILALSPQKERNIDLLGIDINKLNETEKKQIRLIMLELFPLHQNGKNAQK